MDKSKTKGPKHPIPEEPDVRSAMDKIDHKIVIMSGKGGVGKSTVATNLAFSLSLNGAEVGLLDVDIHGPDIPKMLNIEDQQVTGDKHGIFPIIVPPRMKVMSMAFLLSGSETPVIWRGPVKMGAIKQFLGQVHWGKLDYLIIDLPPGTGDEPLSIAQLIPDSDGAIIVTTPQDVALLDAKKAISFTKAIKMPIVGVIENMSGLKCPHCSEEINVFKKGGGENAARELGIPFLGRIPLDPNIVETGDDGTPFVHQYSDSEATKHFKKIILKIENYINQRREPHENSSKLDR